MILRFKSASNEPEYLGINTDSRTYTTIPEQVNNGVNTVITVACNHFEKLMREVDFNCYGYTENLIEPVDFEPLPF